MSFLRVYEIGYSCRMDTKQFWKIFIIVFVAAFAANTLVAYLWSNFFHNSNWQWDTTTTTSALAALAVTYILNRKKS